MSWLWLLAGAWGVGLLLLGLAMCRLASLSDAARRRKVSRLPPVEWWPRRAVRGLRMRTAARGRGVSGGVDLRDRRALP